MPVKRRWGPRWAILALAVPVIAAIYLAAGVTRVLAIGRGVLAGVLAITVIGSVYVEVAAKTGVVPARRHPLPLTLAMVVALVATGSAIPAGQTLAASGPSEAVVQAALHYLGRPYVFGATGPATFDCSGLVYRAFKDAGQLQIIGGRRMTAADYWRFYASRGLTSKTTGHRGDLVVYGDGAHIGIYLGNGKVVSALTQGVTIHGLYALRYNKFTAFLNVPWGKILSTPKTDKLKTTTFVSTIPTSKGQTTSSVPSGGQSTSLGKDVIARGFAFGSLWVHDAASPKADVISWITRGNTYDILAAGHSPGGALWYQVRKPSGFVGWVWSGWMKVVEGSVGG